MSNMPMGNRGHVGIKKETSWGEENDAGVANDFHLPFLSETLTENIEEVLSAIQRGILDEPKSYQGEKSFGGDVVLEVHPASFGHILRSALNVPTGPVKAGATVLTLEDCEDAWDEQAGVNTGVISGVDPVDKKKGTNAVKLVVTSGVDPGILATKKVAEAESEIDMKADTALKVWVKCNKDCDAGVFQILLGEDAGCATTPKFANIPDLVANVWKEYTIALGYMSRSDIAFVFNDGSPDDITTVAGNFITAGFIEGDKVTVTGTGTSDGTYTITTVEATTLTVETGILTKSEEAGAAVLNAMAEYDKIVSVGIKMVTDKAECTIRLDDLRRIGAYTASTAEKWVFKPRQATDFDVDCPINPYTLEVYRDQGNAFQFLGAIVNTLALSFSTTDKILKATCGIIAKDLGDVEKEVLALETTNPFTWDQAVIKIGGTEEGDISNDLDSFSLTFDNKCVAKYALNNTMIPRKIIRSGYREIAISFSVEFLNRTEYEVFKAGDEEAIQIKFEGANIEAGFPYTLQIDIPKFRYLTYPINIGGPGPIICGVTGKAKYDATAGVLYPIQFTLINKEVEGEY